MPFVGKDLKTLEFQKQRQLNELEQKSKNRDYYEKNKKHQKNFGSSLIRGRRQKSTLEQYLDKSKIDENIENYLVKQLGANPGQAKVFIQGLDDTLKEYLLERLPAFKKVFNDNFIVASSINLKSAFELFNREQLDKMKDLNMPSLSDLDVFLSELTRPRLYDLGLPIYVESVKKSRGVSYVVARRRFTNDYDYLSGEDNPEQETRILVRDIIINYINTFENPIDGWMASYQIAKSIGLRDFPKPVLETIREGIPTSTIATPPSVLDLDSMSEDYTIKTPSFSIPESSEEEEEEEKEERIEPQLSEEGRRLLDDARRRLGIEGSGYNTPGLVKIYKLKK